jgi:superoxide dismutase, Cu-Zn family
LCCFLLFLTNVPSREKENALKTNASKWMVVVVASVLFLAGFQALAQKKGAAPPKAEVTKAVAVLHSTEGNNVRGAVTFTKEGQGVKVSAHIEGLKPGNHGFHIHEFGDCSAKDAASAGGHYNPATAAHGAREASPRHIGDLGNIEAGADGTAHVEFTDPMLKLDGPNTIIGRGVIVHANPDDFKTQPTGNAGGRQACGVIGVGKP